MSIQQSIRESFQQSIHESISHLIQESTNMESISWPLCKVTKYNDFIEFMDKHEDREATAEEIEAAVDAFISKDG